MELYHHGILGQKWGVRRYQNADGSLTAAGRAHYGVESVRGKASDISEKIKTKKKQISDDINSKKAKKAKKAEKEESKKSTEENTEEKQKKKLTNGQKAAIAIAATAVAIVAIKTMKDKGTFDKVEDYCNNNPTFSNMQLNAVRRKEAKSREKMMNEFEKRYGANDPEYRKALERAASTRDKARLDRSRYREETVHKNYDSDYINAFDDPEYRKELRKGFDEKVQVSRPAKWVQNNMTVKDFEDITDSYFNKKAEEYLNKMGLRTA